MNKDIIQALQTHVVRNISILIYDYIIPIIQTRSSNNNKVDMDISHSSQKIIVGVGSTIVGQTCVSKSAASNAMRHLTINISTFEKM